jgi:cyclomaltodextrinase / maltogenic alpha-amylase / neopullulanase
VTAVLALGLALLAQDTRNHVFRYEAAADVQRVSLAGSFNGWNKDATPMRREADGKTWSVGLDLAAGKHWYKFVLDGETWVTDPKAKSEDDGNGNLNSVLVLWPAGYERPAVVGDGDLTVAALKHVQEPPLLNWDRGRLTLSLRARPGDFKSVSVATASGRSEHRVQMADRGGDEIQTTYTATVPWDRKSPIRYSFNIEDGGRGHWVFDATGAWLQRSTPAEPFVLDPKTYRPLQPPTWVEDSVLYQIFPDRFWNGDKSNDPAETQPWDGEPTWFNWFGGDFAGVREKLPHLRSLGVGAVYFNPIFQGPSNHRYEGTDYHKVDHRLGTNGQFAALTEEMETLGIRTVLDGVFNHTAVDFYAFADLLKNQAQSEYRDWYFVRSFPVEVKENPSYEAWWGFQSMPKVNLANRGARDYMLGVVDFWAKNARVHGWRLDVANEVSMDFWREFRPRVKAHGEDKWIVGEVWTDGSAWLKGDQWDSVMNYQFRDAVLRFVARGEGTPKEFWGRLIRVHEAYGPQVSRNMMNLLGSHDTSRILTECGGDARLARLAAMVQFTWVGAPIVYYGDELGMAGGRDPENRRGMRWDLATDDNPFLSLYRSLSGLRRGSIALTSGDPVLLGSDDARRLLVFRRQVGNDWAIVAVNRSEQPQTVTVPSASALAVDAFINEAATVSHDRTTVGPKDGSVRTTVQPLSIAVLRPTRP